MADINGFVPGWLNSTMVGNDTTDGFALSLVCASENSSHNATFHNGATVTTISLNPVFQLGWIDYLLFVVMVSISLLGQSLNGFLLWVLSKAPNRNPVEWFQMNLAVSDVMDGFLGLITLFAARIMFPKNALAGLKVFLTYDLLVFVNVAIENLTTIFVTILRTRQVSKI